ncbi:hypothetical protein DER72_11068 [Halomonas sp. A11-A]|nr:hypothetical protein DER72_11068 [Halomonas sp. A11-A]
MCLGIDGCLLPPRHCDIRSGASATAVLLGWWFWGEMPDLWVFVGSLLIIGSGLAIAYHDRRTTLKRRPSS